MILIADSGSTKTAWRIIDKDGRISQAKSPGINPYYMKQEDITATVREGLVEYVDEDIAYIYFYGSGCSSDKNKALIQSALSVLYPQAQIEIDHDLLAAARALCGVESGIACILGTGSNSCLYDGTDIVDNVTSLGYLLGDEGSGNHLGRVLIKRYFKGELPEELKQKFDEYFGLTKSDVLENLYQGNMPIRFLANFSKFIFQYLQHPYFYQLVYDCFREFFVENVCRYAGHRDLPIHFVGSVAFYYSNVLRRVGADLGLQIGIIAEDPVAGLVLYHKEKMKAEG
ncbi:N-acetylglucosamine kinase [Reichenbachiella sp. 5M10]|uniref:N-acetylglucosamine kinase n=1 Tax=Reichenbachiella sp. 5M10 TaxID=1889772 RepID=UPI000C148F5A|nr:N-acetylglucosamine kinase [Reichenbachiella sp. 5M10]PIB35863.1 N-acetylglucosamine kinase [Reichenbachiella sp. 5M10]